MQMGIRFLLTIWVMLGSFSYAEPSNGSSGMPVTLAPEQNVKVTRGTQFLFESDQPLEIEAIRQQRQWQTLDKNRINFGFIEAPLWLHFQATSLENASWAMSVDYPLLDYLDIYVLSGDQLIANVKTGDLRPFATRQFDHPNFVLPLTLDRAQTYDVYLRIETKGAAEVPITFKPKETFDSDNLLREFVRGIVNGVLAIMLFYNLIIYVFIKQKAYLFYVLSVAVYLVQLSIYDGTGFQHFWDNTPSLNHYMFPFFNGLMQLAQFLFLVVFLDILGRQAWYVKPIKVIIAFMFTLPILGVTLDYHFIIPIQVLFALFVNTAGIVFGVYFSLKGEVSARYFTLAWFLFLVGLLTVNLKSFGLLPTNVFTEYSYQIGAFVEMTLLSLALAQRIQSSQKAVIELQEQNIETLAKFQNLYENSLSGQFQTDHKGEIFSANPAFIKLFDPDNRWHLNRPDSAVNVMKLLHSKQDFDQLTTQLAEQGSLINQEVQLKNSQGDTRWFSVSIRPEHCKESSKPNYDISVIDIHEKKENDSLKERSMKERMATLEQLAVGICHEINTPLGISVTASTHLKELNENLETAVASGKFTKQDMQNHISSEHSTVDLMHDSLKRVANLVSQFKQVSVKQLGIGMERTQLERCVQSAVDHTQEKLNGASVNVEVKVPADLTYQGYAQAIKLILIELIENSLIHSFEHHEQGMINISAQQENEHIALHYEDSGSGIDMDNKHELFNAFFTTKRGTHGHIGLGLYKVFNLVTQLLHGDIELLPEAHVHFVIRFPASLQLAEESTQQPDQNPSAS